MVRIGICDDEKRSAVALETMIRQQIEETEIKAEIDLFYSGEKLLRRFKESCRYDLLLIDMDMPGMNGIETGRNIRKIDRNVLLIYLSEDEKGLRELFEIETFRVLLKPICEKTFYQYLFEAMNRIGEARDVLQFQFNKEIKRVPLNEVAYFESRNRVIHIFLSDGTEEQFYGKLNDLEREIAGSGKTFLRIHQSYLVNYQYIRRMNFSHITVEVGKKGLRLLKISEEREKKLREKMCLLESADDRSGRGKTGRD